MSENEARQPMFKDLSADAQKVVSDQLSSTLQALVVAVMGWGLEVLKHLAVFNGAGLAGATALAQAFSTNTSVHRLAISAADSFIVGLAFAILTMVVVFLTGFAQIGPFIKRNMEVMLNVRPLSELKPTWKTWVFVGINWGMAIPSIVSFFVGASFLLRIA